MKLKKYKFKLSDIKKIKEGLNLKVKPKLGEEYFHMHPLINMEKIKWKNDVWDNKDFDKGNCYTEENAILAYHIFCCKIKLCRIKDSLIRQFKNLKKLLKK